MRLFILILIGVMFFSCNRVKTDYDVIIVGGGLAGLSAAKELNSKKVLVLEKDSILGGRVQTHNYQGKYFYDVGAAFSLHPSYRNTIRINDLEINQSIDSIALLIDDKFYSGMNPLEAIEKYEIDINRIGAVRFYYDNKYNIDSKKINTSEFYPIFNSLVKSVFPGSLKDCNKNIVPFIFERYYSSFYYYGNQNVVKALLANNKCKISTNSTVIEVKEKNNYVQIVYVDVQNRKKVITTKKCIVTTPASVAAAVIEQLNVETKVFLDNVKYSSYYSISIGVEIDTLIPYYAYLIPVNSGFSSIVVHKTQNPNFYIFQLYIAHEDIGHFATDNQRKQKAEELINNIWKIDTSHIRFHDVKYWPLAGVLYDDNYIKEWSANVLKPSKNVVLGGDYTIISDKVPPYGMICAMLSGKNAVELLK